MVRIEEETQRKESGNVFPSHSSVSITVSLCVVVILQTTAFQSLLLGGTHSSENTVGDRKSFFLIFT